MNPQNKNCGCNNRKIGTGAVSMARGVIPQKVSDLENDLNFVSLENIEEILGGGSSDNPLLVNLSYGLTDEQKDLVKTNLNITNFRAEPIASENIDW